MAENKKKIKKADLSNVKISNPSLERFQRENARRNKIEKFFKQRFKMPKSMKRKIYALLGVATIALGAFQTSQTVEAVNSHSNIPPKTATIALPNEGAEIKDDGQIYEIDENSFIIISDNQALAYDVNGNIHNGYIDSADFTKVADIPEEKMEDYTICQVTATSEVNVRSSGAIQADNIISTVSAHDYVLAYTGDITETDGQWISTLSVSDNNMYDGYIYGDYLKIVREVDEPEIPENPMIVDTSKEGNIGLNLRTQPDDSDRRTIMTRIPDGTIVSSLGETAISRNREWSRIEYKLSDGQTFQGWVASEYLTPYVERTVQNPVKEQTSKNEQSTPQFNNQMQQINHFASNNIKTNAAGSVTGIDFSGISPDDLRELIQNGIPSQVSAMYGNVNTSQVAGDINFAYIKLGASPYGKNNEFKPFDYDTYEEQVKVCEELGVPYGFYYYSTAITVEEAKIELEYIQKAIESLKQKYDLKHFKLEIVVDVELANANDRQYRGNIEEQTEAKATLINGIQESGLSDNVLIYGPIRVMRPDSDRIIDLSYLHSLLSNPNDVALWLCSPTNSRGEMPSTLETDTSYAEQQGFDVVAYQVVLDGKVIGQIDINTMDLEHFEKLLEREDKTSHHIFTQASSQDMER